MFMRLVVKFLLFTVPVFAIFGIDDLIVGLIVTAIIGGGVAATAANQQENAMTDAANRQMEFQREQTSTAYQREVKDMQAAGLNPMLAYKVGGAASGSGAMAGTVDTTGGAGDKLAALAGQIMQLKLNGAQAAAADSQAAATMAQIPATAARARLDNAQATNYEFENAKLLPIREKMLYNDNVMKDNARIRDNIMLSAEQGGDTQTPLGRSRSADLSFSGAKLQGQRTENVLNALKVPGASAQAEHDRGFMGGVAPYLRDIESVISSAQGARSLGAGNRPLVVPRGGRVVPWE